MDIDSGGAGAGRGGRTGAEPEGFAELTGGEGRGDVGDGRTEADGGEPHGDVAVCEPGVAAEARRGADERGRDGGYVGAGREAEGFPRAGGGAGGAVRICVCGGQHVHKRAEGDEAEGDIRGARGGGDGDAAV